jgi:sarcosine oxidase
LRAVQTETCAAISAGAYVFACGPWLGKVFPDLLRARLFITRQEVFFFAVPAGRREFAPPATPAWICLKDGTYGIPDIDGCGLKLAIDRHGPEFDPDEDGREMSAEGLRSSSEYLGKRFPRLRNSPLLDYRVCPYENTSNGDFLIDRHPDFDNVWIAGGGSGHGFKHGPVVGEYVANLVVNGGPPEPRFSLASKMTAQHREVF